MRYGFNNRCWDLSARGRGFGENFNYRRKNMQQEAFRGTGQRLRLRQRILWNNPIESEFDDESYLKHSIEVTESRLQFLKSKLNNLVENKGENKNA